MGKVNPILVLLFLGFLPGGVWADSLNVTGAAQTESVSIARSIEEAKILDGKRFIIEGELVGEPLNAGSTGWWLNLLEEGNPCAVFVASPAIFPIRSLAGGNHHRIGHRLRVIGTLRRICPEHGGDLDLHADRIEIRALPQERRMSAYWWEKWLLLFFAVLSLRLWYHLPKPGQEDIFERVD